MFTLIPQHKLERMQKLYQPGMRIRMISFGGPTRKISNICGTIMGMAINGGIVVYFDTGFTKLIYPGFDRFWILQNNHIRRRDNNG